MDEDDSMDEDDPELSCFCLVSSGDYHCQITGSVSLTIFHVHAVTQRVQLLAEASAGMLFVVRILLVQPGLYFDIS